MGLFDKKIKNPIDVADHNADEVKPQVPTPAPAPVQAVRESAPAPLKSDHPDYGINKAIELMRLLPNDNIELVVRVVKTTLESTNIKVATIIEDAIRKQGVIQARADVLKREISALEAEIATRRGEIATLDADHTETSMVKDRLVLAERMTAGSPDVQRPIAPAAPLRANTPSTAPAASTVESKPRT